MTRFQKSAQSHATPGHFLQKHRRLAKLPSQHQPHSELQRENLHLPETCESWKTGRPLKKLVGKRIQTNSTGRFSRFRTENGPGVWLADSEQKAEARARPITQPCIPSLSDHPISSYFIPSLWSCPSEPVPRLLLNHGLSILVPQALQVHSHCSSSRFHFQVPVPEPSKPSNQRSKCMGFRNKRLGFFSLCPSVCMYWVAVFLVLCGKYAFCSAPTVLSDLTETAALDSIPSAPFLHTLHASASEFFRAAFQSLQARPSCTVSCHEGDGMNWPCQQSIASYSSMTRYYLLHAECFEGSNVSILSLSSIRKT